MGLRVRKTFTMHDEILPKLARMLDLAVGIPVDLTIVACTPSWLARLGAPFA